MTESDAPHSDPSTAIIVYWRPGCGYCSSLRRALDRFGVDHLLVNIWEDPDGAAFVRSVARGNETVPTVSIGPASLVNPSVHEVIAAAAAHAPQLVPDGYEPPASLTGWIGRRLGR